MIASLHSVLCSCDPWSPDLSSWDIFLCRHLKVNMFSTPVPNLFTLKSQIQSEISKIWKEIMQIVYENALLHFRICIGNDSFFGVLFIILLLFVLKLQPFERLNANLENPAFSSNFSEFSFDFVSNILSLDILYYIFQFFLPDYVVEEWYCVWSWCTFVRSCIPCLI